MELLSILVPAAYAAALAWALGADFLRAQLGKDLEARPAAVWMRAMQAASWPTLCLIGALAVRVVVPVRGLLLAALFTASVLSLWRLYRLTAFGHTGG